MARELEVQLPVGYKDASGKIHRRAVIRKMTGHEEALLFDTTLSSAQLVTELIRSCLIRLEELASVDADVVRQFYSADRNYLLLELRRFTLGDQLLESYFCPRCGAEVTQSEDLSKVDVRRVPEGESLAGIQIQLEDGYTDREGKAHAEIELTLPRGSDEEFVAPMVEKDPLKAQDALLLRCIKRFGTLSKAALEGYGIKILRDLTLGDRRKIQAAFEDQSPGVNFRRAINCQHCGARFEGIMDISHFFALS